VAVLNPELRKRWRSGDHVGAYRPRQVVEVQRGVMDRLYQPFTFLDGSKPKSFGFIQDSKHGAAPWQGQWRATGDWVTVPNVTSVEKNHTFDDNGLATATITIENLITLEWIGHGTTIHMIRRGYMSPWLGFTALSRMRKSLQQSNEWLGILNGGYKIRVKQGYGDQLKTVFVGLIDDTDVRAKPDEIVVTCRDFGELFTDQRVFGSNKAMEIRPPVIFCDRLRADNTKKVGTNAKASSEAGSSYKAANVLKVGDDKSWRSQGHDDPGVTEWVQIDAPPGRYTSFWLWPDMNGLEAYISVYVHSGTVDGSLVSESWVDLNGGDTVPGANGGIPYTRHIPGMSDKGQERELGCEIVADGPIAIRVSFRNLQPVVVGSGVTGGSTISSDFYAGVNRMVAYQRKRKKEAKQKHWILIDDAADVLRWVCMWAGFHEWDIEDFGVRIKEPLAFHQSDFLIDIINHMKEQGEFVFFMGLPSADDDSIGVPTFRRTRALKPSQNKVEEVRDTDLLTGVDAKSSKAALSYIIRVRGKAIKGGVALGEDTEKRVQYTYFPPWSGAHHSIATGAYDHTSGGFIDRLSGLRKHEVRTDPLAENVNECAMGCILIAIQQALAAETAIIEIPGHPGLELDEHISVVSDVAGVNSMLWLASVSSSFTVGTETEWKTTVGGSRIDTPEMQALANDYLAQLAKVLSEAQ
jgi:hypothetical protein